jgi:phosphohistidine phosphatase
VLSEEKSWVASGKFPLIFVLYLHKLFYMSKQLILIRHAQADLAPGQPDHQRPLTSKGRSDAFELGKNLRAKDISLPDRLFVSTAERARLTAEIAWKQWGGDLSQLQFEEELYNIPVGRLLRFVNQQDDGWGSLGIVGHNPTMTYLAEYLTGEAISFSPGTGAVIHFELQHWADIIQQSGRLAVIIETF